MISIYDPKTDSRRDFRAASGVDLPMSELLLLNILVELQAISAILADQTPGPLNPDVTQLRVDVTSN